MTKKSGEPLVNKSYSIFGRQPAILDEEAAAREYDSTSALVRDIFDAWFEENHKGSGS